MDSLSSASAFIRGFFHRHPRHPVLHQLELLNAFGDEHDTAAMEKRLSIAKECFIPSAFKSVTRAYTLPVMGPVLPATVSALLQPVSISPQPYSYILKSPPSSISSLLSTLAVIFSTSFLDHLEAKFALFDRVCGGPICEALLQAKTTEDWCILLVERTLEAYMRPAFEESRGREEAEYATATATVPATIPQYDGDAVAPPPAPGIPLTQVRLRGATIKEAWAANATIKQMTAHEKYIRGDWEPSTPGGLPIFHGTLNTVDGDVLQSLEEALATKPTGLRRMSGVSQLYPADGECRGILTSFSALRAFLWSAFHGEVIDDPPNATTQAPLRKGFKFHNQQLEGILVLSFYTAQPAPPGLTFYQVPKGQESHWREVVHRNRTLPRIWSRALKAIHKQDSTDFPDVLHGRDLPGLRKTLESFSCNRNLLWQTAWMSKPAEEALNQNTFQATAISFELVLDTAKAQQPPETKKRGLRALAKRAGRRIKDIFSRKKEA